MSRANCYLLAASSFFLLLLLRSSHSTFLPSLNNTGVAGITITVSESGLTYAKEVLVKEILAEITPLLLPDIKARVATPLGRLDTVLSHVELSGANVSFSELNLGKTGVTVFAGDVHATMRVHWFYEFTASFVPFPVHDAGWADVEVNGMEAGVTFTLEAQNGTLSLTVVECGTYIDDLEIQLQGGASWLYQLFVGAFDQEIRSATERALSARLTLATAQLSAYLQALPRFLPIDEVSAIDVTIAEDPSVSPASLSVGLRGQFRPRLEAAADSVLAHPAFPVAEPPAGLVSGDDGGGKMVTIALHEDVVNSAADVYSEAGFLQWRVDSLPPREQPWLNTHFWRFLIPQLYKKFPNKDMALDFACSSPPAVHVRTGGVTADAAADLMLLVKDDAGTPSPVACMSLALSMDAVVNVVSNNITAKASLNELDVELKWSDVGRFPVKLLLPTLRTVISRVILPILNKRLEKGFPLPVLPAVDLANASIRYEEGFILVCSDVYYKGGALPPPRRGRGTKRGDSM